MKPVDFSQLERIYDSLAVGIDKAGVPNEALFLAKLALLLGAELGSASLFEDYVRNALDDLN